MGAHTAGPRGTAAGSPKNVIPPQSELSRRFQDAEQGTGSSSWAHRFLVATLDSLPAAVLVIDPDYRVVFANRVARAASPRLEGEGGIARCYRLTHHLDRPCGEAGIACPLTRVLETSAPVTLTHRHFDPAGREAVVEVHATAVLGTSGDVIGMIESCCDVSRLQAVQEQLVNAERLAAIGEAMTGLAHESRNALQRSQACLEMLETRLQGDAGATELLGRLQTAQDELHQLYEEVREYAAPLTLRPCVNDMQGLLRDVWAQVMQGSPGRQASLALIGPEGDAECEVDAFVVRRIFRNLLENSFEASGHEVRVVVRFESAELAGRAALRIRLRDHGCGIADADLPRVFDPFFTTKAHGTGVGLAIAKRAVEAHGGRIEAIGHGLDGLEIHLTFPRQLTWCDHCELR